MFDLLAFKTCLRSGVSAVLCGAMVAGSFPVVAAAAKRKQEMAAPVDRAALVLDRFTFGPRPGEIEAVRSAGVDAWFERQLNPERIDDSALEQRLTMYPALRMSQADRMRRYPEPSVVRQMAKNGGRLPDDPEERAILTDQVDFYQMVQEQRAKRRAEDTAMGNVMATPSMIAGTETPAAAQAAPVTRSDGSSPKPAGELRGGAAQSAKTGPNGKVLPLDQTVEPMPGAQVEALLSMPAEARYRQVLAMSPESLATLRKGMRGSEGRLTAGMTPLQQETMLALSGTNRMMIKEVTGSRLLRDVYSDRQVEAVMTDFWLNHFNVYDRKNQDMPALLPAYEATVRKHALGHFEDLLVATATSPAMMLYLDNAQSTGPDSQAATGERPPQGGRGPLLNPRLDAGMRPLCGRGPMGMGALNAKPAAQRKKGAGLNENYARELMELHTLGVNGGYTQQDVTEVAKVFTGWTLDRPNDGGEFTYNDRRHEPGAKLVLGRTITQHGQDEGREVLHMLASSPATAQFICGKLAGRFVSDDPPQALVDRMAQSFLTSKGDIRAVLRTLYQAPEFTSPTVVHAKLKTPLEYVVSAARVSGADVTNPAPLVQALERLGMPLYGAQPPTGYKWNSDTWLSTSALVNRMNFALSLSTNRVVGAEVDWTRVLQGEPATADRFLASAATDQAGEERRLELAILDRPASVQTRNTVLEQASDALAHRAAADFRGNAREDTTPAMAEPNRQPGARPDRGPGGGPAQSGPLPADREAATMAGLLIGSPEFQRR